MDKLRKTFDSHILSSYNCCGTALIDIVNVDLSVYNLVSVPFVILGRIFVSIPVSQKAPVTRLISLPILPLRTVIYYSRVLFEYSLGTAKTLSKVVDN